MCGWQRCSSCPGAGQVWFDRGPLCARAPLGSGVASSSSLIFSVRAHPLCVCDHPIPTHVLIPSSPAGRPAGRGVPGLHCRPQAQAAAAAAGCAVSVRAAAAHGWPAGGWCSEFCRRSPATLGAGRPMTGRLVLRQQPTLCCLHCCALLAPNLLLTQPGRRCLSTRHGGGMIFEG